MTSYKIEVLNGDTGELKTFIPTNFENYKIPMDFGHIHCHFREEVGKGKGQKYGRLGCSVEQMGFDIFVDKDSRLAEGMLNIPMIFEDKTTKKETKVLKGVYTFRFYYLR